MSIPAYIMQIVPAPDGWLAQGSATPGEEFWYESEDGTAQVFPDEWSGWVLQQGEERQIFSTPAAAFRGKR